MGLASPKKSGNKCMRWQPSSPGSAHGRWSQREELGWAFLPPRLRTKMAESVKSTTLDLRSDGRSTRQSQAAEKDLCVEVCR